MDEHSFDNIFGSQLPDLVDKNWGKLQGKLEQFNLQRKLAKMALALYGLSFLSVLFMGLSAVMYYQMIQNKDNTKKLEMSLLSAFEKKYTVQDTIYQKVIIHDTIYRTSVFTINERKNNNAKNMMDVSKLENQNVYYQEPNDSYSPQIVFIEREKYLDLKKLNSKELSLTQMQLAKLNLVRIDSLSEDTIMDKPKFTLKPSSVTVGLMSGYQVPSGANFKGADGYAYGLRMVLGYNNRKGQERWGIVLDLQRNKYLYNNLVVQKGVFNLPPNIPQPIDTQLKGGGIKEISTYQLGVGVRYNILTNNNIKPYFGVNWSLQIPQRYIVNYISEDKIDLRESNLFTNYDDLKPILNIFGANMGINYNISDRVTGGLEFYYQRQNSTRIETPNALGSRISLNYTFGK
jgi:opacity protein-like surface antigen